MRRTAIKKYTVNTVEPVEGEDKNFKVFENLKVARNFASEQFRFGNFISLLNFKRIPLPI